MQFDGRANPTGVRAGVLVGGVVAAVGTGLELTLVGVGVAAGTAAVHESASAAASESTAMYFMCRSSVARAVLASHLAARLSATSTLMHQPAARTGGRRSSLGTVTFQRGRNLKRCASILENNDVVHAKAFPSRLQGLHQMFRRTKE